MDAFKLKSGIIDISRGSVTIELGRNLGVNVGDEYVIVSPRVTKTGHETTDETGLLVVKEVREDYSIAQLLYANPKPQVGDQVKEVARFGMDLSLYGSAGMDDATTTLATSLRFTLSRGFYRMRPAFDMELPLMSLFNSDSHVPLNMFVGGEFMNLYLGRLQLSPFAAVGIAGMIPTDENGSFYIAGFGGKAELSLSYLMNRDLKLFASAGYEAMLGTDSSSSVSIGGGISFKY